MTDQSPALRRAARALEKAADGEKKAEPDAEREPRTSAERELRDAVSQLPEGAVGVRVFRKLEAGKKAYAGEYDAADWMNEATRRLGGGSYLVSFVMRDPNTGHRTTKGAYSWEVDPALKPQAEAATPAEGTSLAPPAMLSGFADLVQAQIKQMLDGQTMMATLQLGLIKQLLETRPAAAGGGDAMELLKAILPGLISKGGGEQLTPAGMLELLDRAEKRAAARGDIGTMLDTVAKIREAFGGEEGGKPGWEALGSKALGLVERVLDKPAAERPRLPMPRAEAAAVTAGTGPAGGDPPAPAPADFLGYLAPFVPQLVEHAQLDHAPETYAAVLLDMIPAGYHGLVADVVRREDALEQLSAAYPEIAALAGWFGDFLGALRELLELPAKPAPRAAPPAQESRGNREGTGTGP